MNTLKVTIHPPDGADLHDIAERFAKSVVEQAALRGGCEITEFTMERREP